MNRVQITHRGLSYQGG